MDGVVLFERFLFSRKLLNNIWHHSIMWKTPTHKHLIVLSRSTIKRDWWKNREEDKAKFFGAEWAVKSENIVRTGIYIGRVAFVYITEQKGG